jgi:GNAT superfamily N-acetyltransferase
VNAAEIRRTAAADRSPILQMITDSPMFRECEAVIAAEVLDEAIEAGPCGHYQSWTAVLDGAPVGWICWGRTPCAENTWDIYWLVVGGPFRSRGLGKRLMDFAEGEIRGNGGRLTVVETSSRLDYERTRAFYARQGYVCCATVPDFYSPGDDMKIHTKQLQPPQ